MIRYLKRSQINNEKYNACIEKSSNSRIYAYSWYLDCVTENWDALVLNNYEAVFPLPWKQKYLIKYIYPPVWTQQLGVFSTSEISEQKIDEFLQAIPKKFKKITLQFNTENEFNKTKLTVRYNYILKLNKNFNELKLSFSLNRLRDLKKAHKVSKIIDEEVSPNDFFKFYSEFSNEYQSNEFQKSKLKILLRRKECSIIGVRINNNLASALLYFIDSKRITYLLPIASTEGKRKGLPTFLISYLIEKHQQSNLIFDFEGSMVKDVANFYESFGSANEKYYLFIDKFPFF